jgi:hypothetical protein
VSKIQENSGEKSPAAYKSTTPFNNMPEIIYYQLGIQGLEQLAIATNSLLRHEPNIKIILYTDQDETAVAESGSFVHELRPWQHPTKDREQATYGSGAFGVIVHEKIKVVLDAMNQCDSWLVYSDVDIVVCHPFSKELGPALQRHPFMISSEGDSLTSTNFCTGLFAARPTPESTYILEAWKSFHAVQLKKDSSYHDQLAFNDFHAEQKHDFSPLKTIPQGYAMPGWMFHLLAPFKITTVNPRFFHCNWVVGHKNKVQRMKAVERSLLIQNRWSNFIPRLFRQSWFTIQKFRPSFWKW